MKQHCSLAKDIFTIIINQTGQQHSLCDKMRQIVHLRSNCFTLYQDEENILYQKDAHIFYRIVEDPEKLSPCESVPG